MGHCWSRSQRSGRLIPVRAFNFFPGDQIDRRRTGQTDVECVDSPLHQRSTIGQNSTGECPSSRQPRYYLEPPTDVFRLSCGPYRLQQSRFN